MTGLRWEGRTDAALMLQQSPSSGSAKGHGAAYRRGQRREALRPLNRPVGQAGERQGQSDACMVSDEALERHMAELS
jgi:hypothetical protein